jgi:hypothetical protein
MKGLRHNRRVGGPEEQRTGKVTRLLQRWAAGAVVAIDEAPFRLEKIDAPQSRIVELRYELAI